MSILYFPQSRNVGHRVRCLTESYKILTNQTWHALPYKRLIFNNKF